MNPIRRGNEDTGQTKDMGQGTQGLDLRHRNTKHQTHHRETQSYVCRYESTDRGKGDVNRTLDMCQGQTEDTCDTGHGL